MHLSYKTGALAYLRLFKMFKNIYIFIHRVGQSVVWVDHCSQIVTLIVENGARTLFSEKRIAHTAQVLNLPLVHKRVLF